MTQANASATTGGSGDVIATHNPGDGKEYQVVMLAGDGGHIHGTKPSYVAFVPVVAVGANKIFFDLFNAVGTGKVLEINGLWAVVKTDVAVTGTLGVELQTSRTSAIGTGGTAATYSGTVFTAATITPKDTNNASLPAGVTLRAVPTAGATIAGVLWQNYFFTEETNVSSQVGQFFNLIPAATTEFQSLTLREGQGLRVNQGAVASVGSIGFTIDFSVI